MQRIAIFLLLFTLVPLRANLDETVEQCVARYGRPTGFSEASQKMPFGTILFRAGGFDLVVFLSKNVEVGARVSKTNKSDFTPGEMDNVMRADTAPGPWTPTKSTDPNSLAWIRPDKATVTYDKTMKMLIFTTPQMAALLKGSG